MPHCTNYGHCLNIILAEVPEIVQGLHIYLLRRIKKNVPGDRWQRELVKFCLTYNRWDAWELEKLGYAKLKLQTRLAIIRVSPFHTSIL